MNEKLPLYNLLEQINDPEDLRKIPIKQLPQVCKELRNDIIKEVSRNPGHFGSSLGTVELTVANCVGCGSSGLWAQDFDR